MSLRISSRNYTSMKAIIVDDELSARQIVRELCRHVPDIEVVAEFVDAVEALKYVNRERIDLVFLDIHMPGLTGIDFIQTLKYPPRVVLTTSDTHFAIEAYEYPFVVDYLVKPIRQVRFAKMLERLHIHTGGQRVQSAGQQEEGGSHQDDLYVNIDRRLIKIRLEDILFIEAQGDYIVIYTPKEQIRVHSTLKKIREKLPEARFLQIHRSFIINHTRIIDIQDNSVLIDRKVIPISRSSRPELMQRLNLL